MSKTETVRGVMATFWQLAKEDWFAMDHKLLRIAAGVGGFTIAALFWYFVLSNIMPF
jgi:phage shock protein PspC (stress-responsive transcriptional regulator)